MHFVKVRVLVPFGVSFRGDKKKKHPSAQNALTENSSKLKFLTPQDLINKLKIS
jgi:hypothetical protein